MNDRVDDRARRAGAAVHARTEDLDADHGLAGVVRRGRRPRPAAVLAVVLVLGVAVPAAGWLRAQGDTRVDLASSPDEPEPVPTPTVEDSPPLDDEPGDEPAEPEKTPAEPSEEPAGTTDVEASPDEPDGTEPDDTAASPEPDDTEADPSAPAGPQPSGSFGTDTVSHGDFPFGGGEFALLTDVRVGGHDGFDRVVLEFDGQDVPSYRVGYVDPPIIQDGSGDEIAVAGSAFLELRLTPASGVDVSGTEWEPTYHGPDRVTAGTAAVTEVVRVDDFEANLAWVVGLPGRQPFAVSVLSDPLRLVVDIRTG